MHDNILSLCMHATTAKQHRATLYRFVCFTREQSNKFDRKNKPLDMHDRIKTNNQTICHRATTLHVQDASCCENIAFNITQSSKVQKPTNHTTTKNTFRLMMMCSNNEINHSATATGRYQRRAFERWPNIDVLFSGWGGVFFWGVMVRCVKNLDHHTGTTQRHNTTALDSSYSFYRRENIGRHVRVNSVSKQKPHTTNSHPSRTSRSHRIANRRT